MAQREVLIDQQFWIDVGHAFPPERSDFGGPSVRDFETLRLGGLLFQAEWGFDTEFRPGPDGTWTYIGADPEVFGRYVVTAILEGETVVLIGFSRTSFTAGDFTDPE